MNTIQKDVAYDAVAIGAHPDDIEMAMAGTVAALTDAGKRVAIVSLTRGELGTHGTPETRAREAEQAARILGADARHYDFPDGAVMDDLPTRHAVARIIRELRPAIVFAPYPHSRSGPLDGKSNVDHLATGLLVRAGCKLARFKNLMPELAPHTVRRIYYTMLPEHVRPSYVADVSAQRETIERAIGAYASQMQISRGPRQTMDFLMLGRHAHGVTLGVELGEGFLSEDNLGGSAATLLEI